MTIKTRARGLICGIVAVSVASTAATEALAVISYSIAASGSNNYYGIQTHESKGGSIGIEYAVTPRFSLGLQHRQELVNQQGYNEVRDEKDAVVVGYSAFQRESRIISNAATVTVSLYQGETLAPYAFVGVAKNLIHTSVTEEGETSDFRTAPWGPQAGLGLSVKMSKQFFLKLSYTGSPGSVVRDPRSDPNDQVATTNSYSQIGISYRP